MLVLHKIYDMTSMLNIKLLAQNSLKTKHNFCSEFLLNDEIQSLFVFDEVKEC